MTPDELKKIALDATKKEYESIMDQMKRSAESGSYSCEFSKISDGAVSQLRSAGFDVQRLNRYDHMVKKSYFIVKFAN